MKLKNIYLLCKNSIDEIKKFDVAVVDGSMIEHYVLAGGNELKKVLEDLYEIKFFQNEVKELSQVLPTNFGTNMNIRIDLKQWDKINEKKNKLIIAMNNVIEFYESLGYNSENKIGLDIKLPAYNSFSEFKNYIVDIEFLLTKCPFFQNDKEELRFESVDVGSVWLTFVVVGIAASSTSIILNNIAAFIDKCIVIKSHYLTKQQQERVIQKMKVADEEKEELYKAIEKIYKEMVDDCIRELEQETGVILNNGEEKGLAEISIDKAEKLLQLGLQIYSTIDSPEEIKALFEPIKMEYLNNKKVKLIDKDKDE